jgi:hypothetical protein
MPTPKVNSWLGWRIFTVNIDLPDGSYTLVPEGGVEGVDGELQYMDVA